MIKYVNFQSLLTATAWALPIVIGLVEVVKRAIPKIHPRFTPVVSSVIGIGTGLIVVELSLTGAIVGLILGFGACGLWDFSKKTILNK
jgi:hypothetical protein